MSVLCLVSPSGGCDFQLPTAPSPLNTCTKEEGSREDQFSLQPVGSVGGFRSLRPQDYRLALDVGITHGGGTSPQTSFIAPRGPRKKKSGVSSIAHETGRYCTEGHHC